MSAGQHIQVRAIGDSPLPRGGTGGVNLAFEQLAPDYLSEIKDQTCHNTLFGKGEFDTFGMGGENLLTGGRNSTTEALFPT